MHIGIYILALQIISNPRIWIGAKELGNCCFRFCVFIEIETEPRGGGERRGDRSPRGRGPSPSDKCFRCNRTGHW